MNRPPRGVSHGIRFFPDKVHVLVYGSDEMSRDERRSQIIVMRLQISTSHLLIERDCIS